MKLFKKKSLSYILVASMAMAALTGCSKDDKKEEAVVEENTTVVEDAAEEVTEGADEEATEEVTEEEATEEETTEEATEEEATEEVTEEAAEGTTFTATTAGFGGDITATVTMNEDGSIADITVDVATETPALGGAAGPQVAAAIVENQSLTVDTVSGATVTSTAVINAVRLALTEAGSELAQ